MNKITAAEVAHLLRKRYSDREWAFMCEVRNGTGDVRQARYADAMAFGLWPSRGLEILGFEIKVSRSDWIKEKEYPEKAEVIAKHCDRWWVAAPVGIVKKEELPPNWGLLEMVGQDRLTVTKDAPKLEAIEPKRGFWMSVMRAFTEQVTEESQIRRQIQLAEETAYKRGYEAGQTLAQQKLDDAEKLAKTADDQMKAWRTERYDAEQLLGVSLANLRRLPIGPLLRLIQSGTYLRNMLDNFAAESRVLSELLSEFVKEGKFRRFAAPCSDCFDANQDCPTCHKQQHPAMEGKTK